MRSHLRLVALVAGVAACSATVSSAAPAEIEVRAPTADAPALTWFQSTSKSGLDYAWLLPKGYDGKTPRNLTVILHGTGLDWRWGPANHPAGVMRPEDVLVSVDGTSPGPGATRLFLGAKKDAEGFAAFLGEMKSAFVLRDVFLYGHSQGGFFVVHFAGEHPELVSGVVAHASGAWLGSKMNGPVKRVAIAFMHGTADPVVPYGNSTGAYQAYSKQDFELLHLRRLHQYNHWPNAVRATECLDWCEGMTTDEPAAALQAARRILSPKKADQYAWQTVVGFGAARDVLRRIEGQGPAPLRDVDPKVSAEVAALVRKVEDHAAKHVEALQKEIGSRKDLGTCGEWLGHLVALREDFRGVDAVEAWLKKIGYDDVHESHAKEAGGIFDAWYDSKDPKKIFETVVESIRAGFLVDGLPPDLPAKMEEWKNKGKQLGIDKRSLEKYAAFEAWKSGWEKGTKRYKKLCDDWKEP